MKFYPEDRDYPKPYKPVKVYVTSRCSDHLNSSGVAYWSGNKWIGQFGFKIGYGKVVAWSEIQ